MIANGRGKDIEESLVRALKQAMMKLLGWQPGDHHPLMLHKVFPSWGSLMQETSHRYCVSHFIFNAIKNLSHEVD
jgi:hypothetical protein